MIALLAALACVPHAPLGSVWSEPPPALDPPSWTPTTPAPDEAPTSVAYLPGTRPPYTDAACLVTARAVLVPESRAADLYARVKIGEWWEDRALLLVDGRAADRAYADQLVLDLRAEQRATEAELRAARWAVPAAAVVGVLTGAAAVTAAGRVFTWR